MKKHLTTTGVHWLWVSVLIIAFDQITKFLATTMLLFNQPVEILPIFNLTLMRNTGAAWSFLAEHNWAPWLFGGFAVIISIVILMWLSKLPRNNYWLGITLALILGGAVGNLIDRVHYGFVIDFIQVHYNNWYFPAFNVADSAITVGAIMLALEMLFKKQNRA